MPEVDQVSGSKKFWKSSFTDVMASGVSPTDFDIVGLLGAGQSISQSGGNLVIAGGTTASAETILRARPRFDGNFTLKYAYFASTRVINSSVFVELVDIIGDNLAYNITGTTSIVVTIPANPFTALNIGQAMYVSNFINSTGTLPTSGRYVILSVSGNDVTFTVSGFPASGTGTVSLFGWNYHHLLYDGATNTAVKLDCQRNGWATGDTTLAINATGTPGHIGILNVEEGLLTYSDQLTTSSTAFAPVVRGSKILNLPGTSNTLALQIRVANGAVAPTAQTNTFSFFSMEDYVPEQVALSSVRNSGLPVNIVGGGAAPTGANGAGAAYVQGPGGANSSAVGNPFRMATTGYSANQTAVTNGQTVTTQGTLIGAQIIKPYAIPEADWVFAGASGGIVNTTTAVTLKAAAGAGVRNYLTSLQIATDTLGSATELAIRDGAAGTVIWRGKLQTTTLNEINIDFPTPLRSTANTLLEIVTLTASVTGGVYVNAQGYSAP